MGRETGMLENRFYMILFFFLIPVLNDRGFQSPACVVYDICQISTAPELEKEWDFIHFCFFVCFCSFGKEIFMVSEVRDIERRRGLKCLPVLGDNEGWAGGCALVCLCVCVCV